MKTMISFIVSAIASVTFASTQAKEIAHVQGVNEVISSVSLMDSGTLVVTRTNKMVKSFKLSTTNFLKLTYLADSLSTAQLSVEHKMVICMMILNPMYIRTLSVLDPKTDEMRLILSPNSCAQSVVTRPASNSDVRDANELRETMIALASQAVRL